MTGPHGNAQAEIRAAVPLRYLKALSFWYSLVLAKHTRHKLGVSRRADLVSLVLSAGVLPDSRR